MTGTAVYAPGMVWRMNEPGAACSFDVVILAGDIHDPGTSGIEWAWRADKFGVTTPVADVPALRQRVVIGRFHQRAAGRVLQGAGALGAWAHA